MNEEQFLEQLRQYEDKWIAISETEAGREIVGCGDDAVEAKRDAERKGYTDVMLFGVPRFDAVLIPLMA